MTSCDLPCRQDFLDDLNELESRFAANRSHLARIRVGQVVPPSHLVKKAECFNEEQPRRMIRVWKKLHRLNSKRKRLIDIKLAASKFDDDVKNVLEMVRADFSDHIERLTEQRLTARSDVISRHYLAKRKPPQSSASSAHSATTKRSQNGGSGSAVASNTPVVVCASNGSLTTLTPTGRVRKPLVSTGMAIVYMVDEQGILDDLAALKSVTKSANKHHSNSHKSRNGWRAPKQNSYVPAPLPTSAPPATNPNRFHARHEGGKLYYQYEWFTVGTTVILYDEHGGGLCGVIESIGPNDVGIKSEDAQSFNHFVKLSDLRQGTRVIAKASSSSAAVSSFQTMHSSNPPTSNSFMPVSAKS